MFPLIPSRLNCIVLRLLIWRLFLPLLLLALLTLSLITAIRSRNVQDQQQQAVHAITHSVEDYLEQASRTLDSVALMVEQGERHSVVVYIESIWQAYGYFDTFYYLNEQGTAELIIPRDARQEGLDLSRHLWVQNAGTEVTISRPFISPRTGAPTVYLSRQLGDGAIVAAELGLYALQEYVGEQEPHQTRTADFVFITDETGTLLAHPQETLVNQQTNLGELEIIQQGKIEESSLIYRHDGIWVLGSATRIESTGWVIVSQLPLWAAYSSYIGTLTAMLALLTAVVILLALSFRNQFRQQLITPLAQLSSAAEALAANDFLPPTAVNTKATAVTEINTLTTSFYHMSQAIQTRQTALEESQREFQTLLNSITDYVWSADVVNEEVTYRYYSPVVEQITGYPQQHFMQGVETWLDIIHPDDRERVRRELSDEFEGKIVAHEYRIMHADGRFKWLHSTTSPTRNAQGKVIRLDGIVSDITERKQTEEALRQAQKMESLGVMAGGMAHDFNNLLIGVLSRASLALKTIPPQSPAYAHIKKAMQAAERIASLTRQLLAYSGGGQFEIRPINLNDLIENHLPAFRATLPPSVTLLTESTRPLPTLEGDPSQIQQIIMNLIINAGEAMGEAGGEVKLATAVWEVDETYAPIRTPAGDLLPSGTYVSLLIQDNGSGMDEKTTAKIFDPFFSTKFTGRGLGLAAVQGIVQAHKGGLQVQSQIGQGTTFQLFFPASQPRPTLIVNQTASPPQPHPILSC